MANDTNVCQLVSFPFLSATAASVLTVHAPGPESVVSQPNLAPYTGINCDTATAPAQWDLCRCAYVRSLALLALVRR